MHSFVISGAQSIPRRISRLPSKAKCCSLSMDAFTIVIWAAAIAFPSDSGAGLKRRHFQRQLRSRCPRGFRGPEVASATSSGAALGSSIISSEPIRRRFICFQIDLHRSDQACRSCPTWVCPPGLPFMNASHEAMI